MRDFWAGSWILHYLSAKVCWKLACKYGPDSIIYPSLFQQPLIDLWLEQKWSSFSPWLQQQPSDKPICKRALLTAGFPNVVVILLPQCKVKAAMHYARQVLIEEWLGVGQEVFSELDYRRWTRRLTSEDKTWQEWLKHQWQTYWTAMPVGDPKLELTNSSVSSTQADDLEKWTNQLNKVCNLKTDEEKLFHLKEKEFIWAVAQKYPNTSVNIGSWWPYIFDQLRMAASSVKTSRNWKIPTAFLSRSTISGIGPAVFPTLAAEEAICENEIDRFWQEDAGLFDGSEKLNATETLKRGLHRVLLRLLFPQEQEKWEERLPEFYPDLSSGVAGWLRTHPEQRSYFQEACHAITKQFPWTAERDSTGDDPPAYLPWGIPWVDEAQTQIQAEDRLLNPRLLNAGWLIDDYHPKSEDQRPLVREQQKICKQAELKNLQEAIATYFSAGNNPTDWYVLAAGDGDGMGKWLKGENLKKYDAYIPTRPSNPNPTDSDLQAIYDAFRGLFEIRKRMGPSTHNALSRALLDFSNQLVPYLTEKRYAGRLIYSGGDDVLAYTNLWEWDRWLWDIRQCFLGAEDPCKEFKHEGNYWEWQEDSAQFTSQKRPLFTMGANATISFGVVIANHSVPLAIALENLWSAEAGAKQYKCNGKQKDAVQVRVIFGNGNILRATSQFPIFESWRKLLQESSELGLDSAIFEQAVQLWEQHPAPTKQAIAHWTISFCDRRDILQANPLNSPFKES